MNKLNNYLKQLYDSYDNDIEVKYLMDKINNFFGDNYKSIEWICMKNNSIGKKYIVKYIVEKNIKKIKKINNLIKRLSHGVLA